MQAVILRAIIWVVPSLGGPLASALVNIILALGKAEVGIMTPVIEAYVARADLMPQFKHGYQKFVWVFKQVVREFPEANSKSIGTLINVIVQAKFG